MSALAFATWLAAARLVRAQAFAGLPTKSATTQALPMPYHIGSPQSFVGSENQLALVDYSDMTIYRANASGAWLSTFQKIGGGPGEVASVGGMQFDKAGSLWISDVRNSRVSVRGADTRLLREFKTSTPVRMIAPMAIGSLLAVASSVKDFAVILDNAGTLTKSIPFPKDVEALNPIQRERLLVRVNDSLTVIQYRWYNRRVALRNDGRVLYDSGSLANGPEVVAMKLDDKGGVGYRIAPKQAAVALATAARADTVYVLLGNRDEKQNGRSIVRVLASTGRAIDRMVLDREVKIIAATRVGIFGVGETDSGYSLLLIRVQK